MALWPTVALPVPGTEGQAAQSNPLCARSHGTIDFLHRSHCSHRKEDWQSRQRTNKQRTNGMAGLVLTVGSIASVSPSLVAVRPPDSPASIVQARLWLAVGCCRMGWTAWVLRCCAPRAACCSRALRLPCGPRLSRECKWILFRGPRDELRLAMSAANLKLDVGRCPQHHQCSFAVLYKGSKAG